MTTQLPPPPSMREWTFIQELSTPIKTVLPGMPKEPSNAQADLRRGAKLVIQFPDPKDSLATAYEDLKRFFSDVGIKEGPFEITISKRESRVLESYSLETTKDACRITAGDTEGIRRALYFLQDEILRNGGAALSLGTIHREPAVKLRLSRCCYGPKNRPPIQREIAEKLPNYEQIRSENLEYRDELVDDVFYYPDAYLGRCAHDGINALWITESFRELCKSKIIPEYGRNAEKRLTRLREIVNQCARYGIKIYLFVLEPRAFGTHFKTAPIEVLNAHPQLAGHRTHFCTSREEGQAYLEEVGYTLFSQVPGLGGIVNLCAGEMPTHCVSGSPRTECPRCSQRDPGEVLSDMLAGIQRGMHRADPSAKLIAWPYSQYVAWGEELTRKWAGQVPKGVILQQNFESAGHAIQAGKERRLDDYWLAWDGPSELFRDVATIARKHGTEVCAKLQVGNAHELATVPAVQVPGTLWHKFKTIHELDVTAVMECWLFGSFPSVMTWAAGELSFKPFPKSEEEFLMHLARRDWGAHASTVVQAWNAFRKGFNQFPYSVRFAYYAPINNGVVWPLYLKPRDLGLMPPFKTGMPPSGDRIGEAIGDEFTFEEIRGQCTQMADWWNRGVKLLEPLLATFSGNEERIRDINVARASGIQLTSCRHTLDFYYIREQMAYETNRAKQLEQLKQLQDIVEEEIRLGAELSKLAEADSRLGFHSETERHIYHPALLAWRREQLEELLASEFPEIEKRIQNGQSPFPEYTGEVVGEKFLVASGSDKAACNVVEHDEKTPATTANEFAAGRETTWQAWADDEALHVRVTCAEPDTSRISASSADQKMPDFLKNDSVELVIEPRRLWPVKRFIGNAKGSRWHATYATATDYRWTVEPLSTPAGWGLVFHISWDVLGLTEFSGRPLRMNIKRYLPAGSVTLSWVGPQRLMKTRLLLGQDNPADLAWVRFPSPAKVSS